MSDTPRSRPSGTSRAGERFAPGTVLIERFRVLGLIGRGGMGEVYRADDLKLDHPVALKFLPKELAGNRDRVDRLFSEVRLARQVSHPAVCRVWDVYEADGHTFLAMELVDGENLASLLRRIGRLPGDKATDIARQVTAGLAAAHEKGVLHRDLKPANVMLDAEGKVRLTDFGLASVVATVEGDDVRSGTPAYMSPEQLIGREVTSRSDIYSLGLLLYELFTGRRAFEGRSYAELLRQHRDERPVDPSVLVPDLDAAVERTILACIEKDPRQRPPSATAVLAMLAGRDRLEAAIAAGDTPSPELVAAAGDSEGLKPRLAWTCFGLVAIAALLAPAFSPVSNLLSFVPTDKGPAALEDRAKDFLARMGGPTAADTESGFDEDDEHLRWVEEKDQSSTRWHSLATGTPPVVSFWYRTSPRPLTAHGTGGGVAWNDPPQQVSGMSGTAYDLKGRLLAFYVVTPQKEEAEGEAKTKADFAPLFAEARLDGSAFREVPSQRTPPFFVDSRSAYEGHWPDRPELPLRIEVAAYRGQPVWFELVSPWTRAERMEPWKHTIGERVAQSIVLSLLLILTGAGAVLARRNIRLGRGDRRGAFRLALSVAGLMFLLWLLRTHHVASPIQELFLAFRGGGAATLGASLLWLFYLALEPFVRRLRPFMLVSWTRLLNGGFRDAVVGHDILLGMAWGGCLTLLMLFADRIPGWIGSAPPIPTSGWIEMLLGTRYVAAYLVGHVVDAAVLGLGALLLFLLLRLLTRRDLLAAGLIVLILTTNQVAVSTETLWYSLPLHLLIYVTYVFLLLRFGILAAIVGPFTANMLLAPFHSYAFGSWVSSATPLTLGVILALGAFGLRTALGGHSGLHRYVAGDSSVSRSSSGR
jgi:serine/threonine protein kinase